MGRKQEFGESPCWDDSENSLDHEQAGSVLGNDSSTFISQTEQDCESEKDDSPEALIRGENSAILWIRAAVILVLIGAAVGTAYFVYMFVANGEEGKRTFRGISC